MYQQKFNNTNDVLRTLSNLHLVLAMKMGVNL